MILRDLDVHASRKHHLYQEFTRSVQCITDLYLNCLGKVQTGTVAKVLIHCCMNESELLPTRAPLDVALTYTVFPFDEYWHENECGRKQMALDALHNGTLNVARVLNWSQEPFERAYQLAVAGDLKNVRYWGKPKFNSQRSYKVILVSEFDTFGIHLFAVILDRLDHEITRLTIDHFLPHSTYLYNAIGKFEWVDNQTIKLYARDGKRTWQVTLPIDMIKGM
jgi:hypothetical protein